MEYILDLKDMVSALKKADEAPLEIDLLETKGERYLVELMQRPREVCIGDVDWDAFDEEDITTIIDEKFSEFENKIQGSNRIIKEFMSMPPITLNQKRFF